MAVSMVLAWPGPSAYGTNHKLAAQLPKLSRAAGNPVLVIEFFFLEQPIMMNNLTANKIFNLTDPLV